MHKYLFLLLFSTGCFDLASLQSGLDMDRREDGGSAPDLIDPFAGIDFSSPPGADLAEAPDLLGPAADMTPVPDLTPVDLNPCVQTLANVGNGDFTVRFTIATSAKVFSTVLYQRWQCDGLNDWWDVYLDMTGTLRAETGQGNNGWATLNLGGVVNDGAPHAVVLKRTGGVLSATIDGKNAGAAMSPQKLGALPALGVATGQPCEGHNGVVPLVGKVSDVCITWP